MSSTVVPSRRSSSTMRPQLLPRARVEAGRRLVEQHHRRAADQPRGQVEPAAHAAGVGRRAPVGGLGEREAFQQLARAPARLRTAEPVQPPDHLQVLAPGQLLVHGRELPGQADAPADRQRLGGHVVAEHLAPAPPSAPAASPGSSPASSCRRRSGRAGRTRCPARPRGRGRRARPRRRTACRARAPRSQRSRPSSSPVVPAGRGRAGPSRGRRPRGVVVMWASPGPGTRSFRSSPGSGSSGPRTRHGGS